VRILYALLVNHGSESVKCKSCGGEGTISIHGSLKTCRRCDGIGATSVEQEIQRVMREFRLPNNQFVVSHEHSIMLRFFGIDILDVENRILQTLAALAVKGIKTRIIFPV